MSETEESVYRCLLRYYEDSVQGIAKTLGTTTDEVERSFARLGAMELVALSDTRRYRAVSPALAVQRLIEARLREQRARLEELVRDNRIVELLVDERRSVGSPLLPAYQAVERVEGIANVRAVIDELTFFARHEGMTTQPHGALSPDGIRAARLIDSRVLRRGVRMRSIMAGAALDDPPTVAYLRELTALGAEIRISKRPFERMLIIDRTTALSPINPDNSALGALLIREPGLVSNLVALFERTWLDGVDLEEAIGPTDVEQGDALTDIERQILLMMVQVDKDDQGARELGISIRTYRKHIADLMLRLGAANRFQAGLQARDRGWIGRDVTASGPGFLPATRQL
jgi:DNA-binding NarL/FixJ family response regulator